MILSADLESAELRVAAYESQDKPFLEIFAQGGKPHLRTTRDLFGKEFDKSTEEYTFAKGFTYRAIYTLPGKIPTAEGQLRLYKVEITPEMLADMQRKFDRAHPAILGWKKRVIAELHSTHKVRNLFGRYRDLSWGLRVWAREVVEHCEQAALNFRIQCFVPETRVLTSDLRWVPLESLRIGNSLLAFDENASDKFGRRQWRETKVTQAEIGFEECAEILLESGKRLIATLDHPHLTQNSGGWQNWVTTERLVTGPNHSAKFNSLLTQVVETCEPLTNRDAGYVAGMFDADGTIGFSNATSSNSTTFVLSIGQCANDAIWRVWEILDRYGFHCSIDIREPGSDPKIKTRFFITRVLGGKVEVMRFLMLFRPERLMARFVENISKLGRLGSLASDRVISVTPVGKRAVMSLETDSRTYVVEGFGTHNTVIGKIINRAFIRFDSWCDEQRERGAIQGWPCIQCHDELAYTTENEEEIPLVAKALKSSIEVPVPEMQNLVIPCELKFGKNWGSVKPYVHR